jgi:UDP-N-acetylmuramoyl-L-alanyl-D-glutamate--2,6-diaminopimelate ligase
MADLSLNSSPKRLSACLGTAPVADDPWITGLSLDSRRIEPGFLFVALKGERDDGHDFISDALKRGACAVVTERPWQMPHSQPALAGAAPTCVCLPDARAQVGHMAARFYDHPSRGLGCIGVTGTNGKTSVAWYVAALLNKLDKPAAYGGTLGWVFRDEKQPATLTTEDPITVQHRLGALRGAGAEWVAMEVSSHALAQQRVDAVEFDFAVLTNLSRDHLDYHGTMGRYAAAKRRLFEFGSLAGMVVNADDALGAEISVSCRRAVPLIGFGSGPRADVRWEALRFHADGIAGRLQSPWGAHDFAFPLYGDFSVANVVAASCAVALAGGSLARCLEAARDLAPAPGRMQFVRRPDRAPVVIDYAHTPDAIAKAAAALKCHVQGRLICVFGCGGDRDRGKRPLMAAAVEQHADVVWVTSDNPRSEPPQQIAAEILTGFEGRIPVHVELDRARAIAAAVAEAGSGDVVLVAGKGHEDYQEIGGRRLPFSDFDQILAVLDQA